MTASWYRALFPARLASPRAALPGARDHEGGFRLATSVGGVLTGRGADVIIIDDPLKPSDAMSESRRAAANEWFDGDALFAPQRQGQGRDRHRHAAAARGRSRRPCAQARGLGDHLSFPAIAEADELFVVETPFGPQDFAAAAGEALHPERESLETLQPSARRSANITSPASISRRPRPPAAA